MKRAIAIVTLLAATATATMSINVSKPEIKAETATTVSEHNTPSAESLMLDYKEENFIKVIDTNKLTAADLENRNGDLIIEKTIGIVTDSNGNGKILNAPDEEYNYISYRNVADAEAGNIVLTYTIYNPGSDAVDDIAERFDYVIDSGDLRSVYGVQ